jgi:hypothetical protein
MRLADEPDQGLGIGSHAYPDRRNQGWWSSIWGEQGKSEFPRSWSDDSIIGAIEDVANDPASTGMLGRGGRAILIGMRRSVSVTVVLDLADRYIVTGFST